MVPLWKSYRLLRITLSRIVFGLYNRSFQKFYIRFLWEQAILNVLDELLNMGLVEYSDVNDDLSVYYQSAFAIA